MSSVSRGHPSPNERLREAIFDAGLSPIEFARKIGVEPKTVYRWIAKNWRPYPAHQRAAAAALRVPEKDLWPAPARHRSESPRPVQSAEPVTNERLRDAIFDAGMTYEQLAEQVEVTPKSVERWITKGRVPYPKHQHAIAAALGVPKKELWPGPPPPRAELLAQEHSQTSPAEQQQPATPAAPAEGTTIQTNARMRALMSWVDTTAPLKEHDIHPRLHAEQAQQPKPVEVPNYRPQYRTMQEYDRLRASWRSR
ncbi:transcriptional regulator [Streptomyces gardneri]|nr:transcriptional regulator [Streptomyces gardneri]